MIPVTERVSLLFDTPEEAAAYYRVQGRRYHIPDCCVDEFIEDLLVRRILPGEERGSVRNPRTGGVYVPCTSCRRRWS